MNLALGMLAVDKVRYVTKYSVTFLQFLMDDGSLVQHTKQDKLPIFC